jgi:hypothetical protein
VNAEHGGGRDSNEEKLHVALFLIKEDAKFKEDANASGLSPRTPAVRVDPGGQGRVRALR